LLSDPARPTIPLTDGLAAYRKLGDRIASQEAVNHSAKEYVRADVTTNSVEGYFSIFKRGLKGVYQHRSENIYIATWPKSISAT
jgi:ISXO2-like transposase domain